MTQEEIIDTYAHDVATVFQINAMEAAKKIANYLFLRRLSDYDEAKDEECLRKKIDKEWVSRTGFLYYDPKKKEEEEPEPKFELRIKTTYTNAYNQNFLDGEGDLGTKARCFIVIGQIIDACRHFKDRAKTEEIVKEWSEKGTVKIGVYEFK